MRFGVTKRLTICAIARRQVVDFGFSGWVSPVLMDLTGLEAR